jgi:antitoxin component YwqK of YwqJK toxin-antitoxin module
MPNPAPGAELTEEPMLDGLVQRHDANGRLVEEASFTAGQLHGPFRLFAPDGHLLREAAYAHGLADGLATDYDDEGQKLAETHWQAGQRHGEARLYADGRLAQAMEWRHGKLDGPLRVYAPTGDLAAVMPHRASKLHGIVQLYDPDGRLMLEAEHVDGLRHGPSVRYDAHGQPIERVVYAEGRPEAAPAAPILAAPAKACTDPAAANSLRSFYAALALEKPAGPLS